MATFKFNCKYCSQKFEADKSDIGAEAQCPTCSKLIIIEPTCASQQPQSSLFDKLNEEQVQAIKATEGFVKVIAGAGAGKTKVLVHRLVYLIKDIGISPDEILSVTFTNKAAGEMKKRVRAILGSNINSRVQTFHGFCHTILKEDIHHIFYPQSFSILDGEDQKQILKEVYDELGITSKDYSYKKSLKDISGYKNFPNNYMLYTPLVTAPNIDELQNWNCTDIEGSILKNYLLKQRKNFALDYNDLILFALFILRSFPEIAKKWQGRLQYIQVDEFQDVNMHQYELVCLLSEKFKNLFVVGDPDQTIYEWRGADVKFFIEFSANTTIILNKNYRSNSGILDVSNSLIKHNKKRIEKDLLPVKSAICNKPLYFHAKTSLEEGNWIATQIAKLKNNLPELKFSDFSILFRSLHGSRSLEEAFLKNKIPYRILNGQEFYQRKEIKDALAFLKLIAFEDDISFLRIINEPPRGIGKKRIKLLKDYANTHNTSLLNALRENSEHKLFQQAYRESQPRIKEQPTEECYRPISGEKFIEVISKRQLELKNGVNVSDLLKDILRETQYEAYLLRSGDEERKNNIEELKQSIYNYENEAEEYVSLNEYLNQIALYSEKTEMQGDNVNIMTIHSAKGLEFPYVFVCCMNEGIFPTTHALTPEKLEEERRVAYVAFTRAEEQLFLSDAEGYNFDNSFRTPSRFLLDIDKELFLSDVKLADDFWELAEENICYSDKCKFNNHENISVGDAVFHDNFGIGVIESISQGYAMVKLEKQENPRKISILSLRKNNIHYNN